MSDETTTAPEAAPAPAPGAEPAPAAPETPAAPSEPAPTPAGEAGAPAPTEPAPAAESPEILQARKILAAANKRSERALAREQAARAVEARAKEYEQLQEAVRKDPRLLVRVGGFRDLQEYLRAVTNVPEEAPGPSIAEQRLHALEQRIKADDAVLAKEQADAKIEEARVNLMTALDANPKYDRITGNIGHGLLWQEVNAYFEMHGSVSDDMIWQIADKVEKYLVDEGMPTKRKPKAAPAPAPEKPGEPISRTMTNGMTRTSPPSVDGDDGLPMDGKARMAAILARYGKPSSPVS